MTFYQSKKIKKAIILLMAFLFFVVTITLTPYSQALAEEVQNKKKSSDNVEESIEIKPKTHLYFALEGKGSQPETKQKTHFACSDKVYSVVELEHIPHGQYSLSLRWKNPANEEQERVDYPFTVTQDKTRLWAWLNLIRSRGAGMVSWINPAAGLEEFIGPWTVDVYINDKKVTSSSFSVDC